MWCIIKKRVLLIVVCVAVFCPVRTYAETLSFEDIANNFVENPSWSVSRVREETCELLKKQSRKSAKPFVFDNGSDWQVETYINKNSQSLEIQYHAITQVLDFVEKHRLAKSLRQRVVALETISELISVVSWNCPAVSDKYRYGNTADVSRWVKKETGALVFLLEVGWLTPFFGSEIVEKDTSSRKLFINDYENHLNRARELGVRFFPYVCSRMEKFVHKYIKDDTDRARIFFRLSWMYLHLKQYSKAKVSAKKIPRVEGMDTAGERFATYAEKELKKRRRDR